MKNNNENLKWLITKTQIQGQKFVVIKAFFNTKTKSDETRDVTNSNTCRWLIQGKEASKKKRIESSTTRAPPCEHLWKQNCAFKKPSQILFSGYFHCSVKQNTRKCELDQAGSHLRFGKEEKVLVLFSFRRVFAFTQGALWHCRTFLFLLWLFLYCSRGRSQSVECVWESNVVSVWAKKEENITRKICIPQQCFRG